MTTEFNKNKIDDTIVKAAGELKYTVKDGTLLGDKDFHKSFRDERLTDELYQLAVDHNARAGAVASLAAAEQAQDLMKADASIDNVVFELPIGDNAKIKGTVSRKHVFNGGDEPVNSFGILKGIRYESTASSESGLTGQMAQVKAYARARGASLLGS